MLVLPYIHTYGSIDKTLTILRKARKIKFLNSLEKYHIFLVSKQDIHMNEFGIEQNNPIYETIYQQLREYPHR
jgi:transcriptional regulator of NAD metabolism